ncbi:MULTISPECIES: acid phosphatase [Aphanothece]|uniref:acid phosphatase n=1 Tax=Aphanothece TaxID=1121 RepID=UPI003984A352
MLLTLLRTATNARSLWIRSVLLAPLLAGLGGSAGFNGSGAAQAAVPPSAEAIQELVPGVLQGYLPAAERLNSLNFVPPAPEGASARQLLDTLWSERMVSLRNSARWDLAIRDADLTFPAAAGAFSCALGLRISETDTPALYQLLRRSLADIGLSTYGAKTTYQRPRPFMANGAPICTPGDEDKLRTDGSYPSGHTAVGWGWALILSELAPDRAEAVLARGLAFGESRTVCNVHWYSDVVAGRVVGAATVARLQTNAAFLADKEAARAEIERARRADLARTNAPPAETCSAEAKALATPN